ncbi:hypothetical protein [Anabaena azotica]|uniref:hypothetical protein n=1 Tax=Anabaena azotica TaxID=197653 RepID=UPI0039A41CF1
MQAIRLQKTIEKNGEISFQNLPVVAGQEVEIIVLLSPLPAKKKVLTARALLDSSVIGLWEERDDITDSLVYARQLREHSQRRDYDSPR